MFKSTYLPVNMFRTNCVIYSAEKCFPEKRLLLAHRYLTEGHIDGVLFDNGRVTFMDAPDMIWTVAEIYLAYEAYRVAKENKFSYYIVADSNGNPLLFVSKAFKNSKVIDSKEYRQSRILVNASTMYSTLVTDPILVNKVASMIDKVITPSFAYYFYNTITDMERNSHKYIQAVIINRDTEDEMLCTSPITTVQAEVSTSFGIELLTDLKKVYEDHTCQTEYVEYVNKRYVRKVTASLEPMSSKLVEYVLRLYEKTRSKKNNYIELFDENYETLLFFSTNYRYLVNAKTFEIAVVKNQYLRQRLINCSMHNPNDKTELLIMWEQAKME